MKKTVGIILLALFIILLPSCTEKENDNLVTLSVTVGETRALSQSSASSIYSFLNESLTWYYSAHPLSALENGKEKVGETDLSPVTLSYTSGLFKTGNAGLGVFSQGVWSIEIFALDSDGNVYCTTGECCVAVVMNGTGKQDVYLMLQPGTQAEGEATIKIGEIKTSGLGLGKDGRYKLVIEIMDSDGSNAETLATLEDYTTTDTEDEEDVGAVTFNAGGEQLVLTSSVTPGMHVIRATLYVREDDGDDSAFRVEGVSTFGTRLAGGDTLLLIGSVGQREVEKVEFSTSLRSISATLSTDEEGNLTVEANTNGYLNSEAEIKYDWYVDGSSHGDTSNTLTLSYLSSRYDSSVDVCCIVRAKDSDGNVFSNAVRTTVPL